MNNSYSIVRDIIFAVSLIYLLILNFKDNNSDTIIKYHYNDTIQNIIYKDSIKYNIRVKDSIIYNIKDKLNDEINKSYSMSDSSAIIQFKELASE